LINVLHSCQGINSEWVAVFHVFLEKTFGGPVPEYYAHNPTTLAALQHRITPHSISLYIQEVMSRKEYGLYREWCIVPGGSDTMLSMEADLVLLLGSHVLSRLTWGSPEILANGAARLGALPLQHNPYPPPPVHHHPCRHYST
jgi:hypothetical protein